MAAEAVVHDATTGFHDIKAIPGFDVDAAHGWNSGMFACIAFAILLSAIFLVWRLSKRSAALIPTGESPRVRFEGAIRKVRADLSTQQRPAREISTFLSVAIRAYLEAVFAIPATDLTVQELQGRFAKELERAFPISPPSALGELARKMLLVLTQLEQVSFGNEEISQKISLELRTCCDQAESLIAQIANHSQAEYERRRLAQQSKNKQKSADGTANAKRISDAI